MSEISLPEQQSVSKPEFDGGAFTITHFSSSPHGFEVKSRKTLGLTEGLGSNRNLSDEQRNRLRDTAKDEMQFKNVDNLIKARDALWVAKMSGAPQEEMDKFNADFENEWNAYRRKGKQYGIRNIEQQGNTLIVDAKRAPFLTYRHFINRESSDELLDLYANVATAMIVRTAPDRDGKRKIILQHRSTRNALYGDIPGASVAGMLDASLAGENRQPGKPDPLDTDKVKANIIKETGEELGLGAEHLEEVSITGLATDKIKPHQEFLLLADSKLTPEEIRQESRLSTRNKNLSNADFEEKFIFIDGSAAGIERLLTQVECPLPPTHAAALVAAGYSIVLEEQGVEAAKIWRKKVEIGVQDNYKRIDEKVKRYYEENPQALSQVPDRMKNKPVPQRNIYGYDPAYTPGEQGLPDFEEEMKRVRLIPEN